MLNLLLIPARYKKSLIPLLDLIFNFAISFILFSLIYGFVIQPHEVNGNSMFPSLYNRDYLITEKFTHYFKPYQRGNIIVFKNPLDKSVLYIKRIVGLPGETIKIVDNSIYINNEKLNEPYLRSGITTSSIDYIKLGDTEVFVMGDNRIDSSDSREWGPINLKDIEGQAVFRYWPLSRFGFVNRN